MATEVIEKRSDLQTTTPMMQQYLDVKAEYEDYILMYRLGDFYECFFEDAIIASRELELTLTGRDCGNGKRAAMCGVPFHKSDVYVGRLVEKGIKVAICEQVSDPKSSVGLVKREVTRVVTPGTITDSSLLTEGQNNFLMAIYLEEGGSGVAVADISTGEISATYLSGNNVLSLLKNEIGAYKPSEVLLNVSSDEAGELVGFIKERFSALVTDKRAKMFAYDSAKSKILRTFPDESDKLLEPQLLMAVGALLSYIEETQKTEIAFARGVNVYSRGQYLEIDLNTQRNLELTESMRSKEKRGSLLWVLDKTKTAMGARLLRSWVLRPLLDPVKISHRQTAVRDILSSGRARDTLGELLGDMLDMERLTAKAVYGTANARDLRAICQSIEKLPEIKALISKFPSDVFKNIVRELDTLDDLCDLLSRAIVDTPPQIGRAHV